MQQPYAPIKDNTASAEPTLKDLIDKNIAEGGHGLALEQVTAIIAPIAAELDQLHARSLGSGDVIPEHILVPRSRPALLAPPAGSQPADASPESDITALTSAAYFALCGVAPTYFRHMPSGHDAQDSDAPGFLAPPSIHRPDLPPAVQDVLVNGLTPASGSQYATAGAFAAALQNAARPGLGLVLPALPFSPLVSRIAAVVLGVLLLGAVLVHFASIHAARTGQPPPIAPMASEVPAPVPVASPTASVPATSHSSALAPITVPPPLSLTSPVHHAVIAAAIAPKMLTSATGPAGKPAQPVNAHPAKIAATSAARAHQAAPSSGSAAFIRVYARQFITVSDVLRHRARTVRARRVLVDGKPSQALATGGFAQIGPGRHMLAFYPRHGVPFDANIHCWIIVKANSRRAIQIPLPRHPGYLSIAHR